MEVAESKRKVPSCKGTQQFCKISEYTRFNRGKVGLDSAAKNTALEISAHMINLITLYDIPERAPTWTSPTRT